MSTQKPKYQVSTRAAEPRYPGDYPMARLARTTLHITDYRKWNHDVRYDLVIQDGAIVRIERVGLVDQNGEKPIVNAVPREVPRSVRREALEWLRCESWDAACADQPDAEWRRDR